MNTESLFHTISLVAIGTSITISVYFRHKANRTGEKIDVAQEGALILYLRRVFGLLLWLSTLAYLINPEWMSWASLPLPVWLRWLGAGLMIACLPLIYWVFSSLGKNVTPTVVTRQEHSLVTHGPYRWVRHPLYTVGFLAFAGLSLAAANWFIGAVVLFGMIPLALRTPLEEARLIERFGDEYRAYIQQTGRYLPRLASFRSS
jgi:protein-S-isoprenylcysteine O-methyltransferase Ste14